MEKHLDVSKFKMQIDEGFSTPEEACTAMRKQLLTAMKYGKKLCLNANEDNLDWIDVFNAENFPTDKIFDSETWYKHFNDFTEDSERKGKQDEDLDKFIMEDNFSLILMVKVGDDKLAEAIEKIPHADKFIKFAIVWTISDIK